MIRRENMCQGKMKFDTQSETHDAIRELSETGRKVISYLCPDCCYWHIGHNGKRKKMPPSHDLKFKLSVNHESKTHIVNRRFIK